MAGMRDAFKKGKKNPCHPAPKPTKKVKKPRKQNSAPKLRY